MKAKFCLFTIISVSLCIGACKKDGSADSSGLIVGKWYVNKEEITGTLGGLDRQLDTIYNSASFNTNDYFQFNNDGTASLSASGDFELAGKTVFKDGSGNVINGTNTFTYSISGSALTLTSTFLHPTSNTSAAGPTVDTIVLLDANNLILLSPGDPNTVPTITYKTYYTRGN